MSKKKSSSFFFSFPRRSTVRALLVGAALDTLSSSRDVLRRAALRDRDLFALFLCVCLSLSRCPLLFLSFMCAEENFFFSLRLSLA